MGIDRWGKVNPFRMHSRCAGTSYDCLSLDSPNANAMNERERSQCFAPEACASYA